MDYAREWESQMSLSGNGKGFGKQVLGRQKKKISISSIAYLHPELHSSVEH